MPEASPNGTETELALAVTQGVPAAKWARTTGVPSITAWRWAKGPVILPFAAMPVSLGAGLGNRACGETESFCFSSLRTHFVPCLKRLARIRNQELVDQVEPVALRKDPRGNHRLVIARCSVDRAT